MLLLLLLLLVLAVVVLPPLLLVRLRLILAVGWWWQHAQSCSVLVGVLWTRAVGQQQRAASAGSPLTRRTEATTDRTATGPFAVPTFESQRTTLWAAG